MPKLSADWGEVEVLRAVFDQLSDALVLYNPDFIITGVNRAAERLFGMSSEEMVGKHCQEIFQCDVCETGCGVLVGINQSPSAPHCTVRLHTNNGMERLVVMRTNQITNGNGVEGVVATIKDIIEEAAPQKREVIAESPSMREVMGFVRRVAASEATPRWTSISRPATAKSSTPRTYRRIQTPAKMQPIM
jgi:PAS domain S-box-containing protein